MMPSLPLTVLVLAGVASPALLLVVLGATSLVNRPLPERWIGGLAAGSMATACAALLLAFGVFGATATGTQALSYGAWSTSYEGGVAIEFLVDRLSLAFAILASAIAGVVSAFSSRYLHREPGYNRYFVLLAMFVTGSSSASARHCWSRSFTSGPQRCRMHFASSRSTASATRPCCRPPSCCGTPPAATASPSCLAGAGTPRRD
jgi:hypothetical protein